MSKPPFDQDDPVGMVTHPSSPYAWVARHATWEMVIWAIELSEIDRHRRFAELARRGPISHLDPRSLQRFASLAVVIQDRRRMGLL
jgi:hypothetical protein